MTEDRVAPGQSHGRPERLDARFTAEGIYGVIISAAVLASWQDDSTFIRL